MCHTIITLEIWPFDVTCIEVDIIILHVMQYSCLLTGLAQSVMNLNNLYSITQRYMTEGLAPATRCTYSAG